MKVISAYLNPAHKGTVIILLATYNGEKYLAEQLDSIINQSHEHWKILVSDDGSTDGTLNILQRYQEQLGAEKISILPGPKKGFALNFISLVQRCGDNADYYAFCDQDDIWLKDKLKVAVQQLDKMSQTKPSLYCSRTILVDADGKLLCLSPYFGKKLSFQNALVQPIAGANTMVFNRPMRELMIKREVYNLISHDWYMYLLVTGVGGEIYYDEQALIEYRQHAGNLIGYKRDLKTRLTRVYLMFCGRVKNFNEVNIKALMAVNDFLSKENQLILNHFIKAREAPLPERLFRLFKIGLYNQNPLGNITLAIAALTKKL